MQNKERILIVDDDPEYVDETRDLLVSKGYDVDQALDVAEARQRVSEAAYDVFLIDMVMPGTSGKVFCREIASQSDAGIIMVSAIDDDTSRVALLEIGADDYITKPFSELELVARIRSVSRRRQGGRKAQSQPSRFGEWELVEDGRHIQHSDGRIVTLTSSEALVLRYFLANPDLHCSRDDILAIARVRQHGGTGDRSVDTLIRRLRKKIEPDPSNPTFVQTVWGEGYVFRPG